MTLASAYKQDYFDELCQSLEEEKRRIRSEIAILIHEISGVEKESIRMCADILVDGNFSLESFRETKTLIADVLIGKSLDACFNLRYSEDYGFSFQINGDPINPLNRFDKARCYIVIGKLLSDIERVNQRLSAILTSSEVCEIRRQVNMY